MNPTFNKCVGYRTRFHVTQGQGAAVLGKVVRYGHDVPKSTREILDCANNVHGDTLVKVTRHVQSRWSLCIRMGFRAALAGNTTFDPPYDVIIHTEPVNRPYQQT